MCNVEYVQIKELKPGMKNINSVFIVLEVGPATLTKEAREVRSLRVADVSGCVNLSVWDAPGALLQPGDIVKLTRGYAALWRSALTLYSGKSGDIQKIGEFCMLFNEQVNMSEPQPLPPPGAGAATPSERTNGAHPPAPRNTSSPAPAAPSVAGGPAPAPAPGGGKERYSGGGGGGGGGDKHGHKTYVRGRGHQRNNNRR